MARVSDKQLIEKVQNQCVRIINPKYKTSIIYKTYSLLKLTDLIDLTNWKFAHQFETRLTSQKNYENYLV